MEPSPGWITSGHKYSLGKFKIIEIISSNFSDHNAVRLDVNHRKKKTMQNENIWKLNSTLLNSQQIIEEIKKRNKNIYRTFHPKTINFAFFSSAYRTFSRIDHILGHKSSLGKFKKIEIIPVILSDYTAGRLDLNYRKKIVKNSNIWRLNNTLLNNQQIIEEIKKRNKNMHRNERK